MPLRSDWVLEQEKKLVLGFWHKRLGREAIVASGKHAGLQPATFIGECAFHFHGRAALVRNPLFLNPAGYWFVAPSFRADRHSRLWQRGSTLQLSRARGIRFRVLPEKGSGFLGTELARGKEAKSSSHKDCRSRFSHRFLSRVLTALWLVDALPLNS